MPNDLVPSLALSAGTVLPDGTKAAAPSSVQGMFSHLKTALTALGRVGDWDPESRSGNPVSSPDIRRYCEGYGRLLRSRGYEEGSAVPWLEEDVFTVVDQLDKEAAAFRLEAEELEAAVGPWLPSPLGSSPCCWTGMLQGPATYGWGCSVARKVGL